MVAEHRPRPVVWPWLVGPALALLIFFALRSVRHVTDPTTIEPSPEISSEAAASVASEGDTASAP